MLGSGAWHIKVMVSYVALPLHGTLTASLRLLKPLKDYSFVDSVGCAVLCINRRVKYCPFSNSAVRIGSYALNAQS